MIDDLFDHEQYILNYPELNIQNREHAWRHYSRYGKNEGKIYIKKNYPNFYVKGYSDLLKEYQEYQNGIIPKIIFKTSPFTRTNMDNQIIHVLEITKKLNPDYTIYYFDDSEIEQFMSDYSDRVLKALHKIKPGAFKADLWRYCILQKYGGCYSDIGHTMKVSFDEIIDNNNLVLVKEIKDFGIHNGFICCEKNSLLMKKAIEKCLYNIENEIYGDSDISVTGPKMFESLIDKEEYLLLQHSILNKKRYITKNNSIIINTKFEDYDKIMYSNKEDYHVLWKNKNIFN